MALLILEVGSVMRSEEIGKVLYVSNYLLYIVLNIAFLLKIVL